jgi:uncharacterized protein YbjT (DUF2867 family)
MHILLTGATGFIGQKLLLELVQKGHFLTCCVRNINKLEWPQQYNDQVKVIETDFSKPIIVPADMKPIDAAYYLIHSLEGSTKGYLDLERETALHFKNLVDQLNGKQIIYLGGIVNETELSEHLASRKAVEEVLQSSKASTTILRAGIIIGKGSASFEIIRDLVEKLPLMIAPKWINTLCQPISVDNVLEYLTGVLWRKDTFNQTYDIGGPDILSYKQMMLKFAQVRHLKRWIITIPIMTPRLSSYWLYFVTSTNYILAVNLVKSMKVEVICSDDRLQQLLKINLTSYQDTLKHAFDNH